MSNIFQKPFLAISDVRHRLLSCLFVALFVFLFLLIFQPFGISNIKGQVWLITLGYGLITFVSMLMVQIGFVKLFPRFYNEDEWTVGREILHTLIIILLVAIGNFFFSAWLHFFELSYMVFLLFIGFTLAVGIFPVLIQVLIRLNIYQRRNLARSAELSRHIPGEDLHGPEVLEFMNEEGRVELRLEKSQLLAIESADNYVQIYFLQENTPRHTLIRNSLKFFEDQLSGDPLIFRCHRSYLVNLHRLQKVTGNARGYQLRLHPEVKEIPVARRKAEEFSELLSHSPNGPFTTRP